MKLVVVREAKRELGKSRRWYDARQPGLGQGLLDDVLNALSRIEINPHIGPRYLNTRFRFHRTNRFPFIIYYFELIDHVCVMAIAHERRRPEYWKRRKPE